MTTIKAEKPDSVGSEFEGEIREFIRHNVARHNVAPWHKWTSDVPTETLGDNVNELVQRFAGTSMNEIDNVIVELQNLRETLRKEAERVQREIVAYTSLSQTTMASMKIIADSMTQWRANARQSHASKSHAPHPPPSSSHH